MFSKIGIGQLCGFLYLFILLTSGVSKFMAGAPLDPEDVSNTLGAVAEGGKRFRISVVLDLVSHVSVVALAGALYLAFSPHNRSLALLGTLWRVAEGTISSRAILLDAHYDTRAMTPGASDCSSCVATLLETARALQAGPPLQNDVILLFTDNEEYGGGLGAAAFIETHPWVGEIGLVLNFEGLGSTGPSVLFETGPDSGWLVRNWGRVTTHPVGQSWFHEIYRLTPIGTDLNWFNDEGIPGLNFGYWANGQPGHLNKTLKSA